MQKSLMRIPLTPVAAVLFVYCLFNSGAVAESTGKYLSLCGERLIPSLFVFSVLAGIICKSKCFYGFCASFSKGGTELALLFMGTLGGFPLGAAVATELYENGSLTKKQAEYLCAFTNTPSLSFILSYVGGIFDSKTGVKLALLSLASSVFVAVVLRYTFLDKNERQILLSPSDRPQASLASAVKEGGFTMLVISACVVFFGSISQLFPKDMQGFLEISGGMASCKSPVQAAVLLGFSGFSVMCQVGAVCKGRLSALTFITAKLIQSAFMGAFAYFLFD